MADNNKVCTVIAVFHVLWSQEFQQIRCEIDLLSFFNIE